jgi:tetratricopeptide (TPR) repeat protein
MEARVLAGKIAFSIENYSLCEAEFAAAEKLRCAIKPRPKADPALYYLWGLVLNLKGKNKEAIHMIERAVKLAPDYGLFRFKLAEFKITNGVEDPNLVKELKSALELMGDDPDGIMANHAGNLLFEAGDADNAKYFFDKAKKQ